jgi:hypothetical protein
VFVHTFAYKTERQILQIAKRAQAGLSPHLKHPIDLEKSTIVSCREVLSLY